jgi:hypothetical protein
LRAKGQELEAIRSRVTIDIKEEHPTIGERITGEIDGTLQITRMMTTQ